jgi:translation elongation factor EF-1beta
VAKSSVLLDVKVWDDETDMGALEKSVRSIQMDGLVWGTSKLVPVAFGVKKLQIQCVIEDDKVKIERRVVVVLCCCFERKNNGHTFITCFCFSGEHGSVGREDL